MTQEAKCFGLSLGIHLAIAACLVLAASRNIERTPKAIMVVLDNLAIPELPRQKSLPAPVKGEVRKESAPARPVEQQPRPQSPPAVPAVPAAPTLPEPALTRDIPRAPVAPVPSVHRQRTEAAAAPPPPVSAVSSHPTPATETTPPAERAQQRYLKEHFIYIRDLITKRLIYPPMARKMGWNGRTVVSFVIAEDGSVHNLRVMETSGYPLLDKSASETVRLAAPFPKPPVRAEIVVPISFKML